MQGVNKTVAIKNLLDRLTHPDLASLYNINMECQVTVGQDGGERVDSDYKGKKGHKYTDGITTWAPFRIPYNAATEPHYEEEVLKYDLAQHAEGIGLTGWDWKNKVSKYVAFDFDALTGHAEAHKKKLTSEELATIIERTKDIEWVTIRKSTSGNGLHLYVFLDNVSTENHTEHAALARSVLSKLSALTGYDFCNAVDVCGGVLWVWHRKMVGTDGLSLIKRGTVLYELPSNWRDYVPVITGTSKRYTPKGVGSIDDFENLSSQRSRVTLDKDHLRLIKYLEDSECLWWWDQDNQMLVTHTCNLQDAYDSLGLKGYFKTSSKGLDRDTQNCFLFPLRKGAWSVRRYSKGTAEHESWTQDGVGWTMCYLNKDPDLETICKALGGLEDPSGGFYFREAEIAMRAANLLGADVKIDTSLLSRRTKLKQHKDGRLVVEIDRNPEDLADKMQGWLAKPKFWIKIFNILEAPPTELEHGDYDDFVRHLVTENNEDSGWTIKSDGVWRREPLAHVKPALSSLGYTTKDVTNIVGNSIFKAWKVVNRPFKPEYPGDREWNLNGAQLSYSPNYGSESLHYPTWIKILNHCGKGLDEAVQNNQWCKDNGILTGGDYLKCWVASLFQRPLEPLPYLFFFGPQNCGKTVFHEALSTLLTKGYKKAEAAAISQAGYNAELDGAILCVIEEIDLNNNKIAYNRIKDWVTSKQLLIHAKYSTPYHIVNSTHWVQCSNHHASVPVFPGDTRITICNVSPLDPADYIQRSKLDQLLQKEAPDFLAEVMSIELPQSDDRLAVPVIVTQDKHVLEAMNKTPVELFLDEMVDAVDGCKIKFSDLHQEYVKWCTQHELEPISKIKLGRELPLNVLKGRERATGQFYVGNVWWKDLEYKEEKVRKYKLEGDFLDEVS